MEETFIISLKNGFNVFGIDRDAGAVAAVQAMAKELAPHIPAENFVVATAENIPFAGATFDLAVCSALLHFAVSRNHFEAMLQY